MRNSSDSSDLKEEYMNENEINKYQIKINNESIPFNYFNKFKSKGNYTIKYSFMNYLANTNHKFYECWYLININLSNFGIKNVTNMWGMFSFCCSLKNINLSNFNTQNVTNMGSMFIVCKSLINIDLSNFNTQNATNMVNMFLGYSSLKKANVMTNDNRILNLLDSHFNNNKNYYIYYFQ